MVYLVKSWKIDDCLFFLRDSNSSCCEITPTNKSVRYKVMAHLLFAPREGEGYCFQRHIVKRSISPASLRMNGGSHGSATVVVQRHRIPWKVLGVLKYWEIKWNYLLFLWDPLIKKQFRCLKLILKIEFSKSPGLDYFMGSSLWSVISKHLLETRTFYSDYN